MLVCVFFAHVCTRDRGCGVHPAFPAPSSWRVACALHLLRGQLPAKLGRNAPRERGRLPARLFDR
jgi:hypothetical protein